MLSINVLCVLIVVYFNFMDAWVGAWSHLFSISIWYALVCLIICFSFFYINFSLYATLFLNEILNFEQYRDMHAFGVCVNK